MEMSLKCSLHLSSVSSVFGLKAKQEAFRTMQKADFSLQLTRLIIEFHLHQLNFENNNYSFAERFHLINELMFL